MDRVALKDGDDSRVFFRRGSERFQSGRRVEEEILDLEHHTVSEAMRSEDETYDNHGPVVSCARNRSGISSRFDGNEYSVGIRCSTVMSISPSKSEKRKDVLPSARVVASFRSNAQMRDVTNTSERFASEAVRIERLEIGEGLDLGGGEAFAENREIRFLDSATDSLRSDSRGRDSTRLTLIPLPLSCICNSFVPP